MTTPTEVFERKETKYVLTCEQGKQLMRLTKGRFVYDEYGKSTISSLYYDTPHGNLINRSLEKPLYKEKLRIRAYDRADVDTCVFIELKKKFKGIVYKRRVAVSYAAATAYLGGMSYEDAVALYPLADPEKNALSVSARALQISRELDYFKSRFRPLEPSMMIVVDRTALRSTDGSDVRVTFDVNAKWRTEQLDFTEGFGGTRLLDHGTMIMEIKCGGAYPLWLVHALDHCALYPQSCSKYGRAYLASQTAVPDERTNCA